MIISIWVILTIIIAVAFWFFYKKNNFKLKKPNIKTVKKETEYSLTNIDKMLDNVTQKKESKGDVQGFSEKDESFLEETDKDTLENSIFKEQNKQEFDFKSGIITSIILKKKEDL